MRNLKLDEVAEYFFDHRDTVENENQRAKYKNHISKTLGKLVATDITRKDYDHFIKSLKHKELKDNTIDNITALLKTIFLYGVDQDLIIRPIFSTKFIKKLHKDKTIKRTFTPEELDQLFIDAAKLKDPTIETFLKCLYYSAARPVAALSIRAVDVDLNSDRLNFIAMKGAAAYTIPMIPQLKELLKDHIDKYEIKPEEYLFTFTKNGSRNYPGNYSQLEAKARRLFTKLNKDIPVKNSKQRVSLYTLRHTRATELGKKISSPVLLQKYLNHSSVEMSMRYVHVTEDALRSALEGL